MKQLLPGNLLCHLSLSRALALMIALVITEMFYKLGSFTLELVACAATYFAADFCLRPLAAWISRRRAQQSG